MRVLLIPDVFQWVLGTTAKQIAKCNPDIEFLFCRGDAHRDKVRWNELLALAEQSDVVHWISDVEYLNARAKMSSWVERPTLVNVHHVLEDDDKHGLREYSHEIVCTTSSWREFLRAKRGVRCPIHVIPHAIPAESFFPVDVKNKLRKSWGIPVKSFVVGIFANVSSKTAYRRKGTDMFLETALKVGRELPRAQFLVAGPGWRQTIDDMTGRGLKVLHCPYMPNNSEVLRQAYNILDAYMIVSRAEGGPVTLVEAMACGVPVVSTPVGMATGVIIDHENGILIPMESAAAAAEALRELAEDPGLRSKMARNAAQTIRDHYLWQDIGPEFVKLYDGLAGERQESGAPVGGQRSKGNSKITFGTKMISYQTQQRRVLADDGRRWSKRLYNLGNRIAALRTFLGCVAAYGEWLPTLQTILRLVIGDARRLLGRARRLLIRRAGRA